MASEQKYDFPSSNKFIHIAKYVLGIWEYTQSDQYAPLYERLIQRNPSKNCISPDVTRNLNHKNFPGELDWIKNETYAWFLEQRLRSESPCDDFLRQDDTSILFQQSDKDEHDQEIKKPLFTLYFDFSDICNKDPYGRLIMTPQCYLENTCTLAVRYHSRYFIRHRLNSVYSLWQDVSGAALIVSTYLGEKKLVQLLLNEVEDERRHINRSSDLLGPALFAAVIKDNNEDVLQSLLSVPNIDPNITFYDSRTPLEVAVFNGHEKAACVLLNHPTINPRLGRHDPPILLVAVKNGMIPVVDLLLQRQEIDVNAANEDGDTAPSLAAASGNRQLFLCVRHHRLYNFDYWRHKFGSDIFLFDVHDDVIMDKLLEGPHIHHINKQHPENGRTILMEACKDLNSALFEVLWK